MIDLTALNSPEAGTTTAVYAVGDIHGRLDLLRTMDARIVSDIASNRQRSPVICYLGDYIDRGPHSAQVVDYLASSHSDGIRRIYLKGNHEQRMLEFFDDPAGKGPGWIGFGGREAFESYGISAPKNPDDPMFDWGALRDRLMAAVAPEHIEFLKGLRLAFSWNQYLFVHAGLNPERDIDQQEEHDLMWIRAPFLSSSRDWGFTVVHGHVIVPEPEFRSNRIGIDTGAYQSGCLSCLAVDQDSQRLLQVSA
jgi:serine/threonine protein phosphatase 1